VNYGMGQSVCPQCGSSAEVRTVAELFSMLNGGQGGATQQGYPGQQMGPDSSAQGYQAAGGQDPGSQGYQAAGGQGPGNQGYQAGGGQDPSSPGSDSTDANSDHPYQSYQGPGFPSQPYQPPSSGPAPGYQGPDYPNSQRRGPTFDSAFGGDDLAQDIAGAVLGAAFKFAGRGLGKRMQKAYEERIAPVIEAKAAQARQQWQPSPDDQAAIVQRYPDLRGCMRDQVVFLAGGSRTVPITEIRMPITLAQADALVDRLRAP
jgi:hypothetical protein